MEIRRIKYPCDADSEGENNWYKFGVQQGSVNIKDEDIENWVNKCVNSVKKQLEEGVESPYSFTASGNTIVFCFYNCEEEDTFDDSNYFTVIVAKNYDEGDFYIYDLKDEYKDPKEEIIREQSNESQIIDLGDYIIEIKSKRRND